MRGPAFACVAILIGCGGGGGGGDDGTGQDGPTADAPPVGTPLDERLVVSTVAAPDGVIPGGSSWRIWGNGGLRVGRIYTVPYGDCGTLIGYTTGSGAPTARVARLDATDQLITTYDLGAFELRGLAAEPDGHWAALLWDDGPSPPVLHVQRFDASGAPGWSTALVDPLAAPTDFGIGESRFEYGDGRYGAYYHVHGISDWATGHEGDALKWIDAASGQMSNGWSWGCSHSMSELLRFSPAATNIVAVCVTDCYPGTSGSNFATDSIGGVYVNNSTKVRDVDGGCNGSVAGELGSAAPGPDGWKLVFNAHQQPVTLGQMSYNEASMDQDIGFASITTNRTPGGGVTWLTTTPAIEEHDASIARWQPAGDDTEQYVVGWSEPGQTPVYKLARLAPDGSMLGQAIDITARAAWGERDDPFRDHLNSDIVWAWFDAAGSTELHVARIRAGRTATCASF